MEVKLFWNVELTCCNRPWGLFGSITEAMREARSLRRTHKAYYKWASLCGLPEHATQVTIERREYWNTPNGYVEVR